jgi:hypothetical protein
MVHAAIFQCATTMIPTHRMIHITNLPCLMVLHPKPRIHTQARCVGTNRIRCRLPTSLAINTPAQTKCQTDSPRAALAHAAKGEDSNQTDRTGSVGDAHCFGQTQTFAWPPSGLLVIYSKVYIYPVSVITISKLPIAPHWLALRNMPSSPHTISHVFASYSL